MHNTYLYMMIVRAAWVTHIVHNSFSSFILHRPLSIFCISARPPPPSPLFLNSLFVSPFAFASFLLNTLYYLYAVSLCRAVLYTLCTLYQINADYVQSKRYSLTHSTLIVSDSPHFSSSSSPLHSRLCASLRCYLFYVYTLLGTQSTIDELLCVWVRYWLRFRVCLCQVYVRHKSARFYTLRFRLLLCLLLVLLVLFSPLHNHSIFFHFISLLFTTSWSVRFHSQFRCVCVVESGCYFVCNICVWCLRDVKYEYPANKATEPIQTTRNCYGVWVRACARLWVKFVVKLR